MVDRASVPLYAVERGNIGIPAFVICYFLRTIREGYVIAVFRR